MNLWTSLLLLMVVVLCAALLLHSKRKFTIALPAGGNLDQAKSNLDQFSVGRAGDGSDFAMAPTHMPVSLSNSLGPPPSPPLEKSSEEPSMTRSSAPIPKGQFQFPYVNLRECPKECDSSIPSSCARCIQFLPRPHEELAYRLSGPNKLRNRSANLLEVHNVIYNKGAIFYGRTAQQVMRCGNACRPSRQYRSGSWEWYRYDGQSSSPPKVDEATFCQNPSNQHLQPALIVRWMYPNNLGHFLYDSVLVAFITVGQIAGALGIPPEQVRVYVDKRGAKSYAMPVWNALHGELRLASDMHGCYKHVFYGALAAMVPKADLGGVTFDSILSTWMDAYRFNVMRAYGGLSANSILAGTETPKNMLLLMHPRTPKWMHSINWNHSTFGVANVAFERMSYEVQIKTVMHARGFIGVSGAGIAHQFYLPQRSMILVISTLMGRNVCVYKAPFYSKKDGQIEEAGLCWAMEAINLGNNMIWWRWCRPNIHGWGAKFTQKNVDAIIDLMVSEDAAARASKNAHLCLVLDNPSASKKWPRCDQHILAPVSFRARDFVSGRNLLGWQQQGSKLGTGLSYNPIDADQDIHHVTPLCSVGSIAAGHGLCKEKYGVWNKANV